MKITLPKSNSSTTPPSEITSSMSAETPNLQASSGQGSVEIPTKDAELKEANKLETEISK